MIPRRCRYLVVTPELMADLLFTPNHFHVPSDAKLIGYEKHPVRDDFFVLVYSDTYDYVPEGKAFPVVKVPFLQKNKVGASSLASNGGAR